MMLQKSYDTWAGNSQDGSDRPMWAWRTRSGNLPSRIVIGSALCIILCHGGVKREAAVLESLCVGKRIAMQAALALPQGIANLLLAEPGTLKQAMSSPE